jgi:arylsulfatase A-like enzyme
MTKLCTVVLAGVLTGVPGLLSPPRAWAQSSSVRPSLVVVLVVDQLRADYLERYSQRWTGGLKRLMEEGAWYHEAAFPHVNTVTCTGHATVGTGRLPRNHGMVLNSWFERSIGRTEGCTADPSKTILGLDRGQAVGESARKLQAPTLGERVKTTGGRSVSISLKSRSAITLAGREADAVVWFGGPGTFVTSSAYGAELPPFVRDTLAATPLENDRTRTWTKLLPAEAYTGADEGLGEKPPAGWTSSFPHSLDEDRFLALWQFSPHADEYLARLATAAVDAYKLGQRNTTDFLAVSFSTLDIVGHAFGPESHEVQDVLARLDLTIGRLLTELDQRVGRGRYVLALTADHGVAPIPEQSQAAGLDAGRIAPNPIVADVEAALGPLLGPGPRVAALLYTDLYFLPGVWDAILATPRALDAVKRAIEKSPGVLRVFGAHELRRPNPRDEVQSAAARGWFAGRSGDVVLVPKRYWISSPAATTHGTHHDYDQRVPVIFYGAGVGKGRFGGAASPVDVAPTLAHLASIKPAKTDGQVLPVVTPSALSDQSPSR